MIDSHTDLYCIFGRPVTQSKSPETHNTWFKKFKINAAYLAFEPDDINKGIQAVRSLKIKGVSITIPFKESVMPLLDEIDEHAARIGAVNTIVNRDGILLGFNTDYQAAVEPLKPYGIKGKKIILVGAGGAARAVAYGISRHGGKLTIVNRSESRGRELSLKFNHPFMPWDDLLKTDRIDADILINTTPVGMYPGTDEISFPPRLIASNMIVMDIIYNPLDTRLIRTAAGRGCETIKGDLMFYHQAAHQFKLWTGTIPEL